MPVALIAVFVETGSSTAAFKTAEANLDVRSWERKARTDFPPSPRSYNAYISIEVKVLRGGGNSSCSFGMREAIEGVSNLQIPLSIRGLRADSTLQYTLPNQHHALEDLPGSNTLSNSKGSNSSQDLW